MDQRLYLHINITPIYTTPLLYIWTLNTYKTNKNSKPGPKEL